MPLPPQIKLDEATLDLRVDFCLLDLDKNPKLKQTEAAKKWVVSAATLSRHKNGGLSRSSPQEKRRRLTWIEELVVVGWIIFQYSLGYPPPHSQIKDMIESILVAKMTRDPSERITCQHS